MCTHSQVAALHSRGGTSLVRYAVVDPRRKRLVPNPVEPRMPAFGPFADVLNRDPTAARADSLQIF
jgi:hypothetical protein